MAFALVYSAEHYVFDILLGWAVTALVTFGFSRLARRRAAAPPNSGQKPVAATDTLDGPLLTRS